MAEIISILDLNIERSKHLDVIIPFLKERMPDVVCFQELCEEDISLFEEVLNTKCYFIPKALFPEKDEPKIIGVGIFSQLKAFNFKTEYYYGNGKDFELFVPGETKNFHRAFVYCDVEKNGTVFRIGTTHFTWTKNGEADDLQRSDLKLLFGILERAGEIVFMGDFNAPRGREIFDEIAKKYKDNVPRNYTSSIDPVLHRKEGLEYMIDGLFSTPSYKVTDVEMVCGLSDHCGLVANISKT